MKTKLVAALGALLIVGLVVARFTGLIGGALHVGVILPLTGAEAPVGLGMRNAARLAVDEANARGGIHGRRVSLAELDDGSTPAIAVSAAKQLIADKSMLGALVHADFDCAAATKPLLQDAAIPNILGGVPNWNFGDSLNDDTQFRLLPYGNVIQLAAAQYAWNVLGARKFLYFYDGKSFGKILINELRAGLSTLENTRVSGGTTIIPTDAELPNAVAQVREQSPDYVLFSGSPRQAALLIGQLRADGYKGAFQVETKLLSQEFIDIAQVAAEGALQMFQGVPTEQMPNGKAFLDAYAAHGFREPPGPDAIYAYAEMQALLGALDKSFLTRPSITGALAHESFDTALGTVRFNVFSVQTDHLETSSYNTAVVYQVIKGRWTPIQATDKSYKLQPYLGSK